MGMKPIALAGAALLALAGCDLNPAAPVAETKFDFVFAGVPPSTKCELVGSRAETQTGFAPLSMGVFLRANSYGGEGVITCTMPDGKVYQTNWNQVHLGPQEQSFAGARVVYLRGHKSLRIQNNGGLHRHMVLADIKDGVPRLETVPVKPGDPGEYFIRVK